MHCDTVIIGSGVSGLTCALVLAREGQEVVLLEQAPRVGPLVRGFRCEDLRCEGGFHYCGGLTEQLGFTALLRYLGLADQIETVALDQRGFDVLSLEGQPDIAMPCGLEAVRQTLKDHFPRSAGAVDVYIDRILFLHENSPFTNLDVDAETFSFSTDHSQSLADLLMEAGAEAGLIRTLGDHGFFLHGVGPQETPLYIHSMVVGPFYRSAHAFRGGGIALIDAFEQRLAEAAVRVLSACPAVRIPTGDRRRLEGVEVRGPSGDLERIACRDCISTIHPRLLLDLLPAEVVRRGFRRRIENSPDTLSAFALYLDVEEVPPALRKSNHYLTRRNGEGGQDAVTAIMACDPAAEQGQERPSLCVLSKAWGDAMGLRCDRRGLAGFCRKSAARGGDSGKPQLPRYDEYKQQMIEETLGRLLARFPELRGKCRVVAAATPCTFEERTGAPGGSMYGVQHTVSHNGPGPLGPVPRLYLAGQSVGIPGVIGAMISGFMAACRIVGWQTPGEKLRKCR